ncbi:hypothetical protein G3O08_18050 [Cryomorpha ignava]|uniref:Uncharacterized protein n=1 Tax=Cryomorpha ignava TaxID=101383 RepID=A0A7K3WUQ0_9FLAO|nr:hypothetical protein [Cryomorpha ignava]NEN25403.1 hypothetical protein [Cryomorpha ignava]
MNIRQKNPEIALSNTVIAKTHFLDNVFGSANYTPDIASGTTTQWTSGLGKKFIDGRNEMGLAGIFETGMGISNNDVTFFASLIDEYRPGITLGRSQVKESKPDLGGKSQTDSLTAEMKRSWFKDRNFALQKQELSGSTFYIMDQKTLDPPTNISGQINLVISKSEYDSIAIPSNLDTTIHTPLLSFQNFSMEADNNQVPYRKAALKVNGASSSGTKTTAGLGVDLLTFNYGMLNSEAAGNVVDLESALSGILDIDEIISAIKVVEDIYFVTDDSITDFLFDRTVDETCARIRRHYYGFYVDDPKTSVLNPEITDRLKGEVLDNTLPLAQAKSGYGFRYLDVLFFLTPRKFITYKQLTSNANENGIQDNPSPYLKYGGKKIDFGQILYGFESIFFQPHYPPSEIFPPDSSTYSQTYENFPVHLVNDLAGWLANIVIPVTDFFILEQTGTSPYKENTPASNFDAYYEYSAPHADLYGNADAIGIYQAYQVLNEFAPNEGKLRLSDVFTLYYKGESELRPEINISVSPSQPFYTVTNRCKVFSLYFGFLADDSAGGYIWVPDNQTLWDKVKAPYSISNPTGKDYDNRLFKFSEFWLTRRKLFLFIEPALVADSKYHEFFISRFSNINDFDQPVLEWVKSKLSESFESKFLPFVKNLVI